MTALQNIAAETIAAARVDGYSQGRAYVKLHGVADARAYAKLLGDEQPLSNAMFGYVDGFMNAVVEAA